jgi:hypothetical protein
MEHDGWLKIRISTALKGRFKLKYGNGMSEMVRGLIERDLGDDVKENISVVKKEVISSGDEKKLTAQRLQEMVDRMKKNVVDAKGVK